MCHELWYHFSVYESLGDWIHSVFTVCSRYATSITILSLYHPRGITAKSRRTHKKVLNTSTSCFSDNKGKIHETQHTKKFLTYHRSRGTTGTHLCLHGIATQCILECSCRYIHLPDRCSFLLKRKKKRCFSKTRGPYWYSIYLVISVALIYQNATI